MKTKWLAVGIILLFVGTCIVPAIAQSTRYSFPLNKNTRSVRENGTDFTVNISGQSFWMAIKLMFPPNTKISFWHNSTRSYNDSGFGYLLYLYTLEKDLQDYLASLNCDFMYSDPDVYCHIGSLNWSIAHDKSHDYPAWGTEHYHATLPWWENGSWYLIFISYATNRSLSVSIHANMSGSIAVERGDTVIALDRDDFLGGVNVGWRRGVCMVNTQRTLEIKHQFIGYFGVLSWTGFYLLRYQMPNGTSHRLFGVDLLFHSIDSNMASELFVFGPSGTWRFYAMMMNIALLRVYQRVYLFGADVCLPA